MAGEKLFWRIIPANIFDIPGLETWLGDMAEKGYFCYDFVFGKVLGRFTKSTPKTVRYRLEPAGNDDDYPDVERRQLYMERGWRYISTVRKLYHIFLAEDADTPELHTDPHIQSYTLDNLIWQISAGVIASAVMMAVIPGFLIRSAVHGNFVRDYILNAKAFDILAVVLWLLLGGVQIACAARMIRLRKRLRDGIPFEHHKSYKHGAAVRMAVFVLCCALVAALIANFTIGSGLSLSLDRFDDMKPLSELSPDIPVLRLSEIERNGDFRGEDGSGVGSDENTFLRGYTLLVPVEYATFQHGGVKDGEAAEAISLTTHYYKPALAFLAKPIFDELANEFCRQNGIGENYRVLDPGGLDGAVYAQNLDGQQLVAYKDNQIFVAWYNGGEELTEKLPLIAKLLGAESEGA